MYATAFLVLPSARHDGFGGCATLQLGNNCSSESLRHEEENLATAITLANGSPAQGTPTEGIDAPPQLQERSDWTVGGVLVATQLSVGERVVGRESALCLGLSRVAPLRA